MMAQIKSADLLHKLHIKGNPLVLFNVWDAGSARAMKEIGAQVIATSSWAIAESQGSEDGEKLSFNLVIANLKRIIANVDLPVTIDLEGGYGKSPMEVQKTAKKIIEAGAVGMNFEDQIVGGDGLYSIEDQCARIQSIREVADHLSIPIFINARTDIFLKTEPVNHREKQLEEAICRASAYEKAGANGFFAPGLKNANHIEKLCKFSSLPVNIMVLGDTPTLKELALLGVARISYGPSPYYQAMDALKEAGRQAILNMDSG